MMPGLDFFALIFVGCGFGVIAVTWIMLAMLAIPANVGISPKHTFTSRHPQLPFSLIFKMFHQIWDFGVVVILRNTYLHAYFLLL